MNLNRGPDGVVSMPDRLVSMSGVNWETEWFESIRWCGIVPHVGGVHLAMLRMAERMAEQTGDRPSPRNAARGSPTARRRSTTKMWTGKYYLTFWDEKAGKKSDLIFGCQLDGQWMAERTGCPASSGPTASATTLETIEKLNVPPTRYGAIDFVKPDGKVLRPGEFPLAANYSPTISSRRR